MSSTDAQTLISRRVENASNPHDCYEQILNSEGRTSNSELTLGLRIFPDQSQFLWDAPGYL